MKKENNTNKEKLQNEEPQLQNRTEIVVNKVAKNCTQDIFEELIRYDNYRDVAEAIGNGIYEELEEKSFMTNDLALNEKQTEVISQVIYDISRKAVSNYIKTVNKLERANKLSEIITIKIKEVIEQALASISYEINRGFIIRGVAVSCNAKSDKHNEIAFQYGKMADASIPTAAILIATNAVEDIVKSIAIEVSDDVLKIKYNDEVIEVEQKA
ncbi:hypothetical protein [Brachyspira sp. G79]|uniref:hypothetical protein n=1 Tax=Brachyspira sp. G79 TaxID=1358104 RepID=UPI000BBCA95C|nr:hypothetical protein [Brachyspira sp. G79]PCG20530.1 hypothetical protein KQ44_11365 [Brachyspira sp. G79]